MRVRVDHEVCVGSGSCVFTQPGVFDQHAVDGRVVVIDERPDEARRESVLNAVARCPAGAITLEG